jgi:phage recombination protein Bet
MYDVAKQSDVEIITAEKIVSYMDAFGIATQLTDGEKRQFIEVATAYNLNPFKREIYCLPYETSVKQPDGSWKKERKLSIITGYEVYLKRAERVGTLDGWEVAIEGSGDDMKAVLTVHRKNWGHPFKHEVYFGETAKKDKDGNPMSMWKTMPKFMLKK